MRERDFGMSAGAVSEIGCDISIAGKPVSIATPAPAVSNTKHYTKMLQCKSIEITELVGILSTRLSPIILVDDCGNSTCSNSRKESKSEELPELPGNLRHTLSILEDLEDMVRHLLDHIDL